MNNEDDPRLKECHEYRCLRNLPLRNACLLCALGDPCPMGYTKPGIPQWDMALAEHCIRLIEDNEKKIEELNTENKRLIADWSKAAAKPVTRGQIIPIPLGHCEFRGKSIRVESCVIARAGSLGLRHGPEYYDWSWRIGGRVVKKDGTDANDGRHYTRFFVKLDWKPEPTTKVKA